MINIDSDYWMKDVELKQIRGRLILTLLELMDKKFQEDNWISKNIEPKSNFFASEMCIQGEELFDDLLWYDYFSEEDKLKKRLKLFLKPNELEPLLLVYKPFNRMLLDYQYDHEFMNCLELPIMRKKSLEAFKIFLENEKDNYNFCEYVLAYAIRVQNRVKEGECEGAGYEFVKNYIKIVEERGFESSVKYDI